MANDTGRLSDEDYAKTYDEGTPHGIPDDVLAEAIRDAEQMGAQQHEAAE